MTMDLEERLKESLDNEALKAPPAGDLLGLVHLRRRRHARRRLAVTATAAVGAVVLGAFAMTALPGGGGALRQPDQVAAGGGTDPLIAGPQPALRFPLTPGWLPGGVSTTPHVSLGQSGYDAAYRNAQHDGLLGIDIWSSDHDISLTGDRVGRRPTTVDGHPGVVATTDGQVNLTWQPSAGAWWSVVASNDWATQAIARKVAGALVERPFDVPPVFTFDVVPRNAEVAEWTTDGRVVFVPVGQGERWRNREQVDGVVQVAVRRARADLTGHGERVMVHDRPGWIRTESSGRTSLVVQLSEAIVLVLDTPAWSREDVLRLAAGTHYNGGLPPAEG